MIHGSFFALPFFFLLTFGDLKKKKNI